MNNDRYTQYCSLIDEIWETYREEQSYMVFESYLDVYNDTFKSMSDLELRKNTIIFILLDECFEKNKSKWIEWHNGSIITEEKVTEFKIKLKPITSEQYKSIKYYNVYSEEWCLLCEYSNK